MNTRPDRKLTPGLDSLDERIAPSSFVAPSTAYAPPAAASSGFAAPGAPIPGHPGHYYGGPTAGTTPEGYPINS